MRVLEVIHDYLPRHAAGSEIYTAHLCRALREAGHEVAVFTTETHPDREQFTLLEHEHDGVPVHEAVYNHVYGDLSEHWDDPRMAATFERVLDAVRPDLVHVQGMQLVGGVSMLERARARAPRLAVTLHEYWWLCARSGLMYDVQGHACEDAPPERCAFCVDVYPIDRERWSGDGFDELGERRWFARALAGREAALARARDLVDVFVAPSAFLRGRVVAAGFDPARVVHADYGFPPPAPAPAREGQADPPRVAFVGTLSDYKGVEVFARAVASLPRGTVEATIHGEPSWFPRVAEVLGGLEAETPDLRLAGAFAPERREGVFAGIDWLVVPSLWWENSPLTIHEAHQRGVPVLASDRGGMAELLARGGGLTFAPGDHEALGRLLARLARDPDVWRRCAASIPPVRPIGEDVRLLERIAEGRVR